jgi:transcriptional regulator with XRE-family HTH domain
MPRKNPVSQREIEIGRRLAEKRKAYLCPRSYIAMRVGMDSGAIARIELGRVPLKYYHARLLLQFLDVNPIWVATGSGNRDHYFDLPEAEALGCNDSDPFSVVYDAHLRKGFLGRGKQAPRRRGELESSVEVREAAARLVEDWGARWLATVPDSNLQGFLGALKAFGDFLISEYPKEDYRETWDRQIISAARPGGKAPKRMLTDMATSEKLPAVKSQLDSLLADLNRLTQERGMRTKLAKHLGAPLASVSRWLSGEIEPGGETTLRMLQWVRQQERK